MIPLRSMEFNRKYALGTGLPVIGISIVCLIVLTLQVTHYFHPSANTGLAVAPLITGGLISFLFLALGHYIRKTALDIEFFNVRQLTGFVLTAATGVLVLYLLPQIIDASGFAWKQTQVSGIIFQAFTLIATLAFYMLAGVMATRLLMIRHDRLGIKLLNAFIAVLIVSNVFNFYSVHFPDWFFWAVIVAGGIPGFLLIVRMDWIALISKNHRTVILLYVFTLLAISLLITNRLLGFGLSKAFHIELISSPFLILLTGFVNVFAAISLLGMVFNIPVARFIEEKNTEIAAFSELSKIVNKGLQWDEILDLLLTSGMGSSNATSGWVSEVDTRNPADTVLAVNNMDSKDIRRIEYTVYNHPEHYQLDKKIEYIYIRDIQQDFYLQDHGMKYASMVIFPIQAGNGKMLRLYLLQDYPNGFEEYTIGLVKSYIDQSTVSLSHIQMMEETVESVRIKEDLAIGKRVQKGLLPSEFDIHDGLDIHAISIPAEEVGGDYFDLYRMSDHKTAFIMSDVSGKGTSAAFHVAEMKGIFQSLILSELSPVEFMQKANLAITKCFDKGMFITVVYALLDTEKGIFTYSRAGHCPVLVYDSSDNSIKEIKDEGLGLGIIRDNTFNSLVTEYNIDMNDGDAIILYTDGISEARAKESGIEYGYDRLRDCIYLNIEQTSKNISNKIIQDIQQFTGTESGRDDMSLMVIKLNRNQ